MYGLPSIDDSIDLIWQGQPTHPSLPHPHPPSCIIIPKRGSDETARSWASAAEWMYIPFFSSIRNRYPLPSRVSGPDLPLTPLAGPYQLFRYLHGYDDHLQSYHCLYPFHPHLPHLHGYHFRMSLMSEHWPWIALRRESPFDLYFDWFALVFSSPTHRIALIYVYHSEPWVIP